MLAMLVLWAAALIAILWLIVWLTSPSYSSDEPRPIPHWIPILGHAIPFVRDKKTFFKWADIQNFHQPFTVFVAGRKHYIFSSPNEVATIHRNSKTLDIAAFLKLINTKLLGMLPTEADKLDGAKPEVHALHNKYLLTPEWYQLMARSYLTELETHMRTFDAKLDETDQKSCTTDLFSLVSSGIGTPSINAFFGKGLLEIDPAAIDDMWTMVRDAFYPIVFGAPRMFFRRAYGARERAVAACRKVVDCPSDDTSPFIKARIQEFQERGMTNDTIARDFFGIIFGLTSNSNPTSFAALLHLMEDPVLTAEIRQELFDADYANLEPSDQIVLLPTGLPRLRALWHETLRRHNNNLSVREVMETTTIAGDARTYQLQKGSMVSMPAGLLHLNDRVYQCPEEFRPKRFLDAALGGEGENYAKGIKSFGGGAAYCPGRVFAEKQVMGFLAAIVWRYDLTITSPKWRYPDNLDPEYVCNEPKIFIQFKKRENTARTALDKM